MRSELCGDILIILFWGKVTGIKNYKYTYLLKISPQAPVLEYLPAPIEERSERIRPGMGAVPIYSQGTFYTWAVFTVGVSVIGGVLVASLRTAQTHPSRAFLVEFLTILFFPILSFNTDWKQT